MNPRVFPSCLSLPIPCAVRVVLVRCQCRDILNAKKGEIVCENISNGRAERGVGTGNKLVGGTSYSTQSDGRGRPEEDSGG